MSPHVQRAGWATCDITPPLGLPMGGRGARFSDGDEILDPLFAHATVLEDGDGSRAVFVSVDLVELSEHVLNPLSQAIAAMACTQPEMVLVNASHTHSSPMMGLWRYATDKPAPPALQAYVDSLHEKLLGLVSDALKRLEPVKITWRTGSTDIGINRRKLVDGKLIMAPNFEDEYDRQLWVLDVQATAAKDRRCVLFSNACHPVMVYGFAWNAISAEWPGKARNALRDELGQNVHCQFFQGFAGNLRPRILADESTGMFRKATPADVQHVGQTIADDILKTLTQPGDDITLSLQGRQRAFVANRAQPQPLSHWQSLLDSPLEHLRESAKYWAKRTGPGGLPPYPSTPWAIGLLQLDASHAIAWMGGEPVIQWQRIVASALPQYKLATWGYTQFYGGYLAVDELLPQGGYEVDGYPPLSNQSPAPFVAGLDAAVTRVFKQMAQDIHATHHS